jgi:molybdenum cofactor cytidylyltransferase
VHSIRKDGMVLKKGTLVGKAEIAALEAAKVSEIVVARLEPGDVSEDVAAAEIAAAVRGRGRACRPRRSPAAPICSPKHAGVLVVDKPASMRSTTSIRRSPSPPWRLMRRSRGKMIATVKIIPFRRVGRRRATRRFALRAAARRSCASRRSRSARSASFRPCCPGLADKVIEKTLEGHRPSGLAPAGPTIVAEKRVPHEDQGARHSARRGAKGGAEMVVVFGASAIAGLRATVIPAAVEAGSAGGSSISACRSIRATAARRGGDARPVLGAPAARDPRRKTASTGS